MRFICNSVLSLVSHEINGDSIDKLRDAQEELKEFLINCLVVLYEKGMDRY